MRSVTVLFVHGTGVRSAQFQSTLEKIRAGLRTPEWQNLIIEGCNWGDRLGSRPPLLSVPEFLETGGRQMTDDETKHQTWMLLATDPCCELRLLSLNKTPYKRRSPREVSPPTTIKMGLEKLKNRALQELQHQMQKLERQVVDLEHQLKELPPAEKHLAEQRLIEELQRRLTVLEHQQQELSPQRQAGKLQQPLEEQERLSMRNYQDVR